MYFDSYSVLYVALKSLSAVIFLFILTRLMGKKQISHLTPFDYVTGIAIGSIAGSFSVEPDIGIWQGLASLLIWALFPIVVALITQKNYGARKLLDGTPVLLIQNGELIEKNIRSSRLTVNDLLEELRLAGAFDPAQVQAAVFETGGRVSVLKKAAASPATPYDLGLNPPENGLCINLVIDGKVLPAHLALAGRDEFWLQSELKNQGYADTGEVLLASIGTDSNLIVYRKNVVLGDAGLM